MSASAKIKRVFGPLLFPSILLHVLLAVYCGVMLKIAEGWDLWSLNPIINAIIASLCIVVGGALAFLKLTESMFEWVRVRLYRIFNSAYGWNGVLVLLLAAAIYSTVPVARATKFTIICEPFEISDLVVGGAHVECNGTGHLIDTAHIAYPTSSDGTMLYVDTDEWKIIRRQSDYSNVLSCVNGTIAEEIILAFRREAQGPAEFRYALCRNSAEESALNCPMRVG